MKKGVSECWWETQLKFVSVTVGFEMNLTLVVVVFQHDEGISIINEQDVNTCKQSHNSLKIYGILCLAGPPLSRHKCQLAITL